MKNKLYITSIFFLTFQACFGQKEGMSADTFVLRHFKYLWIVEFSDRPPIASENVFINPAKIDSLNNLAISPSSDLCKLLKIDGVWLLKVRPGSKVLTLNGVFDQYKISMQHRMLPVMIDDEMINDPETILISPETIAQVKIRKKLRENVINIILQGSHENKKVIEKANKTGVLDIH